MGDLSAADVSLTIVDESFDYGHNAINIVDLAVGDGSKTYPVGGYIPLPTDLSKYGLGLALTTIAILEKPLDGLEYRIDRANLRLYIYTPPGFTPAGSVAAPAFTGESYTPAGTITNGTPDTFAGTAHTLAGSNSAPAFTGTPVAAAALAVLGNVALAAKTLRLLVIGQ